MKRRSKLVFKKNKFGETVKYGGLSFYFHGKKKDERSRLGIIIFLNGKTHPRGAGIIQRPCDRAAGNVVDNLREGIDGVEPEIQPHRHP